MEDLVNCMYCLGDTGDKSCPVCKGKGITSTDWEDQRKIPHGTIITCTICGAEMRVKENTIFVATGRALYGCNNFHEEWHDEPD